MTVDDPLEALVARAQAGDRQAFDELAASEREPLERRVRRAMGTVLARTVEVEDVLQETYLRAFRSLDRLEWHGRASLLGWLERIAEHVVLDLARHRQRAPFIELPVEPPADGLAPSTEMRRAERFDRLRRALESLPPDDRQVIRLARLEGLPLGEVAARMNRSANAVSHLLHRALERLRDVFGETESFHLPDRSLEEEGGAGGF